MNDKNLHYWEERIEIELEAGQKAWSEKNDGKARACARRAAGIAIKEYLIRRHNAPAASHSALDRLRDVSLDHRHPEHIRKAAGRLVTNINDRLSPEFTLHPINDAKILISYFKDLH